MYYDTVLAILRKHNINNYGRNRIKDTWKVLHEKNLTGDGKERKKMMVEKVLFKDIQTMLIMLFYLMPLLKNYGPTSKECTSFSQAA